MRNFSASCVLVLFIASFFYSCEKEQKSIPLQLGNLKVLNVDYATTFQLYEHEGYFVIELLQPWPEADESRYLILIKEDASTENIPTDYTQIQLPIERLVVTSTTHIPSLISLDLLDKWVGFPGLDYVSSKEARERINNKQVKEIGKNEGLNTEVILSIQPQLIIGFAVEGSNKSLNNLEKAGIPTLYNSDWLEKHPLGKAEWIKVFGLLGGKQQEAFEEFEKIATAYEEAKKIASKAKNKTKVISGAMHQDVWYLPHGDSWQGVLLKDANTEYIYASSSGSGSIASSFEKVLELGKDAEFWISPAQFKSYKDLESSNRHYTNFYAFQQKNIFGIAHQTGETGGVLYYELAPNRPDLVLKDLVKILHPEVDLAHELFFFKALE